MAEPEDDEEEDEGLPVEPVKQPKARKRPGLSLSAQEAKLWFVLRDTNPEWTQREILTAFRKLKAIGVDSVSVIVTMLERGQLLQLNDQLKAKGKKPFSQKTLRSLWMRVLSEMPPDRLKNQDFLTPPVTEVSGLLEGFGKRRAAKSAPASPRGSGDEEEGRRWKCERCQWENVGSSLVCAACDSRQASLTPWRCSICEKENPPSALKCRGCLETRRRAMPASLSLVDGKEDSAEEEQQEEEKADPPEMLYYDLLGLAHSATLHDISLAYHQKRRVLVRTEDRGKSNQKTLDRLREAYKVLTDQEKRRTYDLTHGIEPRPVQPPKPDSRPAQQTEVEQIFEQPSANLGYEPQLPPNAPPRAPPRPAEAEQAVTTPSPKATSGSSGDAQEFPGTDLYNLLGVKPTARMDEILVAFQAKLAQPVPASSQRLEQKRIELLNKAFDVLTDPQKRQRYDGTRLAQPKAEAARPAAPPAPAPKPTEPEELVGTDLYDILGVKSTARMEEILAAFQEKLAHPTPASSQRLEQKRMEMLNKAFDVLTDPEKRKRYDASRLAQPKAAPARPAAAPAQAPKAAAPEDLSELDLYALLEVPANAGMNEILPAFQRRLAAEGDPQKLVLLNKALDVLTDADKRAKYDSERAAKKVAEAKAARAARKAAIAAKAASSAAPPRTAASADGAGAGAKPAAAAVAAPSASSASTAADSEPDFYGLLGVPESAGLADILVAFQQRLTTETDPERLKLLNKALDVLSDAEKRRQYDAARSGRPQAAVVAPAPKAAAQGYPAAAGASASSPPRAAEPRGGQASGPIDLMAPPPSKGVQRLPWECPDCRYDNPDSASSCGMCGAERPAFDGR